MGLSASLDGFGFSVTAYVETTLHFSSIRNVQDQALTPVMNLDGFLLFIPISWPQFILFLQITRIEKCSCGSYNVT